MPTIDQISTFDIEVKHVDDEGGAHTAKYLAKTLRALIPSWIVAACWLLHVPLGPLGFGVIYEFDCAKGKGENLLDRLSGPYSSLSVAYYFFGLAAVLCHSSSLMVWPNVRNYKFRWPWTLFCFFTVLTFPFTNFGDTTIKPKSECAEIYVDDFATSAKVDTGSCKQLDKKKFAGFIEFCGLSNVADEKPVFVHDKLLQILDIDEYVLNRAGASIKAAFASFATNKLEQQVILSIARPTVCSVILQPCDNSCKPVLPCKGYARAITASVFNTHPKVKHLIVDQDCQTLYKDGDVVEALQNIEVILLGISEQLPIFLRTLLGEMESGCDATIDYFRDLIGLATEMSDECLRPLQGLAVDAYNNDTLQGNCSSSTWNATRHKIIKELKEGHENAEKEDKQWIEHLRASLCAMYALLFFGSTVCALSITIRDRGEAFAYPWHLLFRVHSKRSLTSSLLLLGFGIFPIPFFMGWGDEYYINAPFFGYCLILTAIWGIFSTLFLLFQWPFWELMNAPEGSLLTSNGTFRASNLTEAMSELQKQTHSIWSRMQKVRTMYMRYFSVQGSYFVLKAGIFEIAEILIQFIGFLGSAKNTSVSYSSYILCLILANSVVSPILFCRRNVDAMIIFDVFIDLIYIIVKRVQVVNALTYDSSFVNTAGQWTEFATVIFPVVSVIELCTSYGMFTIQGRLRDLNYKDEVNRASNIRRVEAPNHAPSPRVSLHTRNRSGSTRLLRLPRVSFRGNVSTIELTIFRVVQYSLLALGVIVGGASLSFLVRLMLQHNKCVSHYSECVWSNANPRYYFIDGAFASTTCGEGGVMALDLSSCNKSSMIDYTKFQCAKSIHLHSMKVFPKSLAILANARPGLKLTTKCTPNVFDLSNAGLSAMPKPITNVIKMSSAECYPKIINISQNQFSTLTLNKMLGEFGTSTCKNQTGSNSNWAPCFGDIDFSSNNATSVPHILVDTLNQTSNDRLFFPKLRHVDARDNHIEKYTPWMLESENIDVEHNKFKKVVYYWDKYSRDISFGTFLSTAKGDIESVESMEFWRNTIKGGFPTTLAQSSPLLQKLFIKFCDFRGFTLPTQIGTLTSLSFLQLSSSGINGSLPTSIGLLTQLTALQLQHNSFTGYIPSQIGLLTGLVNLDLDYNNLHGSIPSQIGLLTGLVNVYFSWNNLIGTIASQIGQMTSLTHLDVHDNSLIGSIPSQIGQMASLSGYIKKIN